jgi:hypothetical protein
MYIIVELFEFFDKVVNNDHTFRQSMIYKFIEVMLNRHRDDVNIGIPIFVIFHNIQENVIQDYIDIIRFDHSKYNVVYDEFHEVFVFKGLNNLFYGLKEIFQKIHLIYENDLIIHENLKKIRLFINQVRQLLVMDDLCDAFNKCL